MDTFTKVFLQAENEEKTIDDELLEEAQEESEESTEEEGEYVEVS